MTKHITSQELRERTARVLAAKREKQSRTGLWGLSDEELDAVLPPGPEELARRLGPRDPGLGWPEGCPLAPPPPDAVWRPLPGFPGYEATEAGHCRSWRHGKRVPVVLRPIRKGAMGAAWSYQLYDCLHQSKWRTIRRVRELLGSPREPAALGVGPA